jgi:hypothetical protein
MLHTQIDYQPDPDSQEYREYSQYNQTEPYHPQLASESQDYVPRESQFEQRQKIPKKLHDLVREKKTLSISGKRAMISEKGPDVRLEHVGTESQKEILEKIKVRNKTPPKGVNYAELKEKEKRTWQTGTPSQR